MDKSHFDDEINYNKLNSYKPISSESFINSQMTTVEIKTKLQSFGFEFKSDSKNIYLKSCPFCHQGVDKISNQYKLGIKIGDGVYHCFRCNSSGSWNDFIKRIEGPISNKVCSKEDLLRNQQVIPYHVKIWNEAHSLDDPISEPARKYLDNRRIGTYRSESMRCHPNLKYTDYSEYKGYFPALLAKIVDQNFNHIGTHRIYLSECGTKANVPDPKKVVGKVKGGYILISDSPITNILCIAEGPETAIAVHLATNQVTISTVSASNMKNIVIADCFNEVYIFADQDKSGAGERAALDLTDKLTKLGKKVYFMIPPKTNLQNRKSIDFLDIYNTDSSLITDYFSTATQWNPTHQECFSSSVKLSNDAYHGLVGEFVNTIESETESDPVAVLGQFLIMFGNLIGRNCYYQVEQSKHFPVLFGVFVGASSVARKGTSEAICRNEFKLFDNNWASDCIKNGISTGEGIIHAIRDPIYADESEINSGDNLKAQNRITLDKGVSDKRLMAIEGEFALLLKTASREGNILTTVLREAWNCNTLQTVTKSRPEKVMEPHFSLIGHITNFELQKYFSDNDTFNGTGNRILWFSVSRSKLLPYGGDFSKLKLDEFRKKLSLAIEFGKTPKRIVMDDSAKSIWPSIYRNLTSDREGIIGAMTSRAEAQVVRLALIYAILDSSQIITAQHIRAALAVWEYAEESCRQIFSKVISNTQSNRIMNALRNSPNGMTRTEIRDLFNRHITAIDLQTGLDHLKGLSLIDQVEEYSDGRPNERWFAV